MAERRANSRSKCDNCSEVHYDHNLNVVKDIFQRVDPGGVMPSGECPSCGALCYPVRMKRDTTCARVFIPRRSDGLYRKRIYGVTDKLQIARTCSAKGHAINVIGGIRESYKDQTIEVYELHLIGYYAYPWGDKDFVSTIEHAHEQIPLGELPDIEGLDL